jgi:hypothetical protein
MADYKLKFIQEKLTFKCLIQIKNSQKFMNKIGKFIIKFTILQENKEYGHLYK